MSLSNHSFTCLQEEHTAETLQTTCPQVVTPSFLSALAERKQELQQTQSHQPLSCKDRKPGGVGLEAEEVLTRRVSCEGELAEFTVAFGHLNLERRKHTVRTTFHQLLVNKSDYLMIWISDCQSDAQVRGAGGFLQIPRLQQEIP